MNYENIYLIFCEHFKKTTPLERLQARDPLDVRLSKNKLYTERHHILPKSLGGTNDKYNLITVLPEEHLFLHQVRYKAYNDRQDFLAVRLIINGFKNKKTVAEEKLLSNKKIKTMYGWFRQEISQFRKSSGWQTEEGRKSISDHRKNKFPGRCSITGEIVGAVHVNDPRVKCGEIIHHSKGRHVYINSTSGEKIFCKKEDKPEGFIAVCADTGGIKNPRYSNITDEQIVCFYEKICELFKSEFKLNIIPPLTIISKLWNKIYKTNFPSFCGGLRSGFRFSGNLDNLYHPLQKKYDLKYDRYSKICRKLNLEDLENAYYRNFGRD